MVSFLFFTIIAGNASVVVVIVTFCFEDVNDLLIVLDTPSIRDFYEHNVVAKTKTKKIVLFSTALQTESEAHSSLSFKVSLAMKMLMALLLPVLALAVVIVIVLFGII